MSPGVVEESVKVAGTAVQSLSRSPWLTAMLMFNILVLGGVFWLVHGAATRNDARLQTVVELLQKCLTKGQ